MSGPEFIVYGNPLPKQSYRHSKHGGYTPKRIKDWQTKIGWVAKECTRPEERLTAGDVTVWLHFYRSDKRRVDLDNLSKAVLDALNGIIWHDDKQVTTLHITKEYDRENPRVEIKVVAL